MKRYCIFGSDHVFKCLPFFLSLQFRSPEEFSAGILDEKVDVYALGNCIYGLVSAVERNYLAAILFACSHFLL